MPIKVSVIVPVWNPGPYIDACVQSILDQTLGPDEVEGILVDDGSTDETPAKTYALAARHPNLRAIHQENSGWPGKPRNVGLSAARGEYVFFLDNDDRLGPEALERLYAMARRNDADVVLGKMAGFHRGVPRDLFFANVDRATLGETPLFDGLTPHKLFRRSFVEQHGLRFPEGRRRAEDPRSWSAPIWSADTISVLSDYVCYYHIRREDHANAGLRRIDPVGYYANLREVIGIVEANTEAGPLRDRLLERFARIELAGRFNERTFLAHPTDYRESIYAEILSVVEDHIPPTVDAILAPLHRVQMALLRGSSDGSPDRARRSRHDRERPGAADEPATLSTPRVRSRLPGAAVRSDRARSPRNGVAMGFLLPVPPRVAEVVPDETRALPGGAGPVARLVLRKRDDWAEVVAPTTVVPTTGPPTGGEDRDGAGVPGLDGRSAIDPRTIAVGSPIWPGTWDVLVRVEAYGYIRDARLGSVRATGIPCLGPLDQQPGTTADLPPVSTGRTRATTSPSGSVTYPGDPRTDASSPTSASASTDRRRSRSLDRRRPSGRPDGTVRTAPVPVRGRFAMRSRRARRGRAVLASALLVGVVAVSAGCFGTRGVGGVTSETRQVGEFTSIDVRAGIDATVRIGPAEPLVVDAQQNLLPIIRTEVVGSTLTIDGTQGFSSTQPIQVIVVVPALVGITLSGGSKATIDGLAADSLSVTISGGSEVAATGRVDRLELSASGGSTANLADLSSRVATFDAPGGSVANLRVSDLVTGTASGGSRVTVFGGATLDVETSGGAEVVQE